MVKIRMCPKSHIKIINFARIIAAVIVTKTFYLCISGAPYIGKTIHGHVKEQPFIFENLKTEL